MTIVCRHSVMDLGYQGLKIEHFCAKMQIAQRRCGFRLEM